MDEIEIVQDYECIDEELGSPIRVFWSNGHGYDPREFIRAVVEYCLDNDVDIPTITGDDAPVESWQRNVTVQGGVFYERDNTPPTSLRTDRFPITVLDLESARRSGGTKCAVDDCSEPWNVGLPVRVCVTPRDEDPTAVAPYMAVRIWFCRKHRKQLPEPSYRVFMVPVGATILLPSEAGGAS